MSLLAHLNELRKRLIICVAAFLVGVIVCLGWSEQITNLLLSRGSSFQFVYIAPAELMMTYVQVSVMGGIVIVAPVIIWQIWRFVKPGLRRRESLAFILIMTVGIGLFALGVLFSFEVVLPMLLGFFSRLNTSGTVSAMVSAQEYINYVISTMLIFGVIFETPVVMTALTAAGLVKPKTLKKNFKYIVLIILIIGAVITPPDVTSQILVSVPLMILFYGSILLCQFLFRRRLKEEEELLG
jgi:sec-independent protein translocase protein TatC